MKVLSEVLRVTLVLGVFLVALVGALGAAAHTASGGYEGFTGLLIFATFSAILYFASDKMINIAENKKTKNV